MQLQNVRPSRISPEFCQCVCSLVALGTRSSFRYVGVAQHQPDFSGREAGSGTGGRVAIDQPASAHGGMRASFPPASKRDPSSSSSSEVSLRLDAPPAIPSAYPAAQLQALESDATPHPFGATAFYVGERQAAPCMVVPALEAPQAPT